MSRTRTSIALVTAATCATVLVSYAQAQPATPTTGATVTTTVTTTPTVTVTSSSVTPTTPKAASPVDVVRGFSSGDFSEVRPASIALFVIAVLTGLLNIIMQFDNGQVEALLANVHVPQLPQPQLPQLPR